MGVLVILKLINVTVGVGKIFEEYMRKNLCLIKLQAYSLQLSLQLDLEISSLEIFANTLPKV